jgi:YihY family inner membrane protein
MATLQQLTERGKALVERARRRSVPFDVAIATLQRFSADDGGSYAGALTYYAFFSIFPLLLLAAAMLGYVVADDPALRADLIKQGLKTVPILRDAFEPDGMDTIIQNRGRIALTAAALALYSGSGAVVALEHALNKLHRVENEPGFLAKRLRSVKWLGFLGALSLLAIGAGSLAGFAEDVSDGQTAIKVGLTAGALVIAVGINTVAFASAYKFLPAVKSTWREVWPGAVVAAVLFQALNFGGTAYLARGETARNDTFGTFAAAATLLVASYLIAQITLLAAEVNLVLADREEGGAAGDEDRRGGVMAQTPTQNNFRTSTESTKSAGQLMKEVTEDMSTLIRKEIELAKQEVGASVKAKLKGALIIAIAGVLGFFALIFLLLALRDGFDNFLWTWVADIATALVLLALGAAGAMTAKKKLTTPLNTELTKQTIKEDVQWAKTLGKQ